MRVTLAQVAATTDAEANRALLTRSVHEGARDGADLVVLPEYASAFDPRGPRADLAEELDGPYVRTLRALAAEARVTVAAGVTLVRGTGDGRVSNAVVVVDPAGEVVVDYRKVHLYDAFGARESQVLAPGDPSAPPAVTDVAGVRTGFLTCYDLRFPESARRLVDAGAHVVVVPAAWAAGPGKADQWSLLARARAVEDVSVVVAVGMAGPGVVARSLVVAPHGEVLAALGADPGLLTVDVDPRLVAEARRANPSLGNRRYEVVPRSV